MSEVTRDDIKEIFRKLDKHNEVLTNVQINVATVMQKVNDMPPQRQRPCDELSGHLKEHKENQTLLKKPLVAAFVGGGVVGLLTIFKAGISALLQKLTGS